MALAPGRLLSTPQRRTLQACLRRPGTTHLERRGFPSCPPLKVLSEIASMLISLDRPRSLSATNDAQPRYHGTNGNTHWLAGSQRARAWLAAVPDSPDIESPLFQASFRRLRLPLWGHDSSCTLCSELLDCWSCGGNRVTRHNAIRDVLSSKRNLVLFCLRGHQTLPKPPYTRLFG